MISNKNIALKKIKPHSKIKSYTIVIAPEKSGPSKILKVSKWAILSTITASCLAISLLMIFISGYLNLKSNFEVYINNYKNNPAESFKFLQSNDISSMSQKQNLKDKINEIEKLEEQLKSKINSSKNESDKLTFSTSVNKASDLNSAADKEIKTAVSLLNTYNNKVNAINHIPEMLPAIGTITSPFGSRKNPTSRGYSGEFHTGVDIGGTYGTPIHAAASGSVEFAGWDGNYGNLIIINHNNGYVSYYGHNSKLLVKKGDSIEKNQTISLMGSSGRSTGCHVHFEVRLNGTIINPLQLINRGN